jgi:[acyl-carrier-protein] S-malonyltransferase
MSKTAVMFSGIDCLDKVEHRLQVLKFPEVLDRLDEAQFYLDDLESSTSLIDYLSASDDIFHSSLAIKALIGAATHVGLYDRLIKFHPAPDYLVGCSLGDIARIVCAGGLSFEQLIRGTFHYGDHGEKLVGGSVVCVKCLHAPVSKIETELIEAHGLYVAVYQTPQHFLVGGPDDILQAWIQSPSTQALYSIRPLCDKPLHSHFMNKSKDHAFTHMGELRIGKFKIPMVSATASRVLETHEDLIHDMVTNMTGPVKWWQTYEWMIKELGVNRFISIGPAETLIRFHERMNLNLDVEVIDSLQLEKQSAACSEIGFVDTIEV